MAKEQKTKKNSKSALIFAVSVILVVTAAIVYFIFFFQSGEKSVKSDNSKETVATVAATEFKITPCDEKEAAQFKKELVGVWKSYTKDGDACSYTFNKDGSAKYQKDGKKTKDYTYTFENGLLTLSEEKRTFVYRCSKDAVDMMTRYHNGEWQTYFNVVAEEIPNFNGCIYIADKILYMGDKCLCKSDALDSYHERSLLGEWVGVIGDKVSFAADGSYSYIKNADRYAGTYVVDFDKKTLDIYIDGKTMAHNQDEWSLDGRILRVGKQYYFKLS